MSAPEGFLRLINVAKDYLAADAAPPVTVLHDVNLALAPGESAAILGPSGSGKTTLLNLIGTLDRPTRGQILLEGRDLAGLDERELAAARNRLLGFVFQFHYLLPQLSVLENVLVPTLADPDSARRAAAPDRARRLLKRVGLEPRLDHAPGRLSGGERQRTAVVRALINQPRLLLADEPTGALDRIAAATLVQLLVELNREEGVTLVTVTHAPDVAAAMQRVFEIDDGRLVERPAK